MTRTLGNEIREARLRNGITLRSFAQELKVSPGLLSLIERDKQSPSKDLLVEAAKLLGADANHWCGLAGTVTPDVEAALAALARKQPKYFRRLVSQWRAINE